MPPPPLWEATKGEDGEEGWWGEMMVSRASSFASFASGWLGNEYPKGERGRETVAVSFGGGGGEWWWAWRDGLAAVEELVAADLSSTTSGGDVAAGSTEADEAEDKEEGGGGVGVVDHASFPECTREGCGRGEWGLETEEREESDTSPEEREGDREGRGGRAAEEDKRGGEAEKTALVGSVVGVVVLLLLPLEEAGRAAQWLGSAWWGWRCEEEWWWWSAVACASKRWSAGAAA